MTGTTGPYARLRAVMCAAAALCLSAAPAYADDHAHRCMDTPIEVVPATSTSAPRICEVARKVRPLFQDLGLETDKLVSIQPIDDPSRLPPGCLAFFNTASRELHVLTADCIAEGNVSLGSFHDLPPEAMFESLIVHELTHAYIDQTPGSDDLSRLAHEYLAYAMQLDVMPEDVRQTVLSRTTVSRDVQIGDFNEALLALHPLRFAVFAWLHLSTEPDRREAIARILDGRTQFYSLME